MGEFVEYETPICCMQRLTRQDNSDKFKFILKFPKANTKDSEIHTTINKARIISKKVNEIIEIDPTLVEYIIEISNQDDTNNDEEIKEFIQAFENLLKSTEEKITITTEDDKKLQKIRFLLGETTSNELQHEMTSIDESISYLNTNQHDYSIEFLSTKMKTLIESGEFFKLDEKIAIEIIDSYFYHQNQKNKDRNEINDEIIEIFNGLKEKENETVVMHFLLQLEYSSYTNEMREYISDNLFDDVVNNELGLIINQFREQLLKPIEKSDKDKKMIQFLFHENHEFDGIIKYLLNQSGDDIDKYMNITSSSIENDKNIPINAVLFDDEDNYFATKNIQNSWICFDFKDHKIIPNNYSICSYFGMIGTCHPKSWVIEGCNDKNDENGWEIIDEQKNSDKLNNSNITYTFDIQNPQQKSFRYIRLRETDSNWNNSYNLCFNAIEFYGYLI